ncbi:MULTISPECIES: hypothetical protein [unclassified Mesorhizobium]|uniref:hypothetical protein n=1 Tax=unclassified Mesorhizobium TaxID=325217 RepID=UPI0012EB3377|nr:MULTISPECIES: hypothetical protein [unclassified Mesorhizobium]WJI57292.1 hypothetical protein NLY33_00570 [Mesorhizobium sp. C432A]
MTFAAKVSESYSLAMARRCIFGCERAGSGEHVFPATLGGRRVNKGILCDKHNNALSSLAGVLSEQLRVLNAQIGVRPDHNKTTPHASVVTDSDGREYVLSIDGFRVKDARLVSEEPLADGSTSVTMEFGTLEEADRWMKAQAEAGNKVEPISRAEGTSLNHGQFRAEIKLGGAEGLRAVGYVALTFLAHRFPDLARSTALEPFRQFVLVEGHSNDFVWWLDPPSASANDPYPFGHKIEIAIPMSGEALGRVTFFSSVAFGVRFGTVTQTKAETITTYIDPLAPHPPDDVREHRSEGSDINLERPASQTATLRNATTSGSAQRAFEAFMRRVTDYRLQEDMGPLLAQLLEAKPLDSRERRSVVNRIVDANAQRVLNLIRYVADEYRRQEDVTSPAARTIVTYLDAMFPENKQPSVAFEIASDNLQAAARQAIAQTLDDELAIGSLDLDRLGMLLGGGPGAEVVGRTVLKALTDVLA